ncbi:MAG TPA: YrzE family protein [Actinomycetes bacterium]|jgi:hypothetical protein|nr:YrzE family protein [Actinomycetes bacterium]
MSRSDLTETRRDRAALARDAGFSRVSFVSVLAGVLVAYGAFAVLLAAAAAVAAAIGIDNTLTVNDWAQIGVGSAVAIAAVVLLAYGFGGYVAGRMARRAGLLNGLGVFVLAVAIIAVLAAVAAAQADSSAIVANLRSLGIPTSGTEWGAIGTVAGLGSLAAMLFGAAFGGILGERWHTKLTRRAATVETAATEHDRDRDGARDEGDDRDRDGVSGGWDRDRDGVPDDRELTERNRVGAEPGPRAKPGPVAEPGPPVPVRSGRVRASSVLAEGGQHAAGPADRVDEGRRAAGRTDTRGDAGRHLPGRAAGTDDTPRDTVVLDDAARHEEQARRLR